MRKPARRRSGLGTSTTRKIQRELGRISRGEFIVIAQGTTAQREETEQLLRDFNDLGMAGSSPEILNTVDSVRRFMLGKDALGSAMVL